MDDQTHAEQFAAFVNALGPEGHYSDLEPEGVASVRDADGTLYELRRDTLRAVLAERDQLAARARAAETHLAEYADILDAITELVEGSGPQCVDRAALDAILGTAPEQPSPLPAAVQAEVFSMLDGLGKRLRADGYIPPAVPQPHAPGPVAAFATGELSNASSSPQRGAGGVEHDPSLTAAAHPLTADQIAAYRNLLPIPPHAGHHAYYAIAHRLLAEVERLGSEVEQLQVELGYALDPEDEHCDEDEDDEGGFPDGFFDPQHQDEPAPHVVAVTHLPGGFDMNDRKPHEQLIGNGVAGWVSHQVQHPPACHQLPYGQPCPFDDEWENGQYTYDDTPPGLYHVQARAHDVADHRGEYSHTEDYLDYQRVGDPPERAVAEPETGYSEVAPF